MIRTSSDVQNVRREHSGKTLKTTTRAGVRLMLEPETPHTAYYHAVLAQRSAKEAKDDTRRTKGERQ
jgi:hypothetical protein